MIFFAWFLMIIGFVGFGAAAYWDLKTTEFPEWLPYGMIVIGLVTHGIISFITADIGIFILSVITGLLFLGFGYLLYLLKQWGDGDAWLLGAMGFLFPVSEWFLLINENLSFEILQFPVIILINFFLVSFLYLVLYSIALGIKYRKEAKKFLVDLKKKQRNMLLIFIVLILVSVITTLYFYFTTTFSFQVLMPILLLPIVFILLILFFQYGRFVEKNLFKKEIDVKKLRIGDVPFGDRWKGLTENEVKKLKEKGGKITIKEGVRFAPVFLITLLITLIIGNIFVFFL